MPALNRATGLDSAALMLTEINARAAAVTASLAAAEALLAETLTAIAAANSALDIANYYTRAQTDALLATKAATSHTHTRVQITDFAGGFGAVGAQLVAATNQTEGRTILGLGTAATVNAGAFEVAGTATTQIAAFSAGLQETVEDLIGASIIAGSNISVTYSDVTGKTTISETAGGSV